jgi:hypothetical protein
MLKRTFLHLPGIGPRRELGLWRAGIASWEDFLEQGQGALPRGLFRLGRPLIERCLEALGRPGGVAELAGLIPRAEHWRFYPTLSRVAYLDIETGGDAGDWGGVTVVGIYDGARVEQFVTERNMWLINDALKGYDVVVTFAGASFDLPVLRQVFPNLYLPPVHIDLKPVLGRLGLKGGLKRIERQTGLSRPDQVLGLDGWDAVRLWRAHQAGQAGALDTLLAYNACDVINLAPLLNLGVGRLRAQLMGRLGPQALASPPSRG